MKLLFKLVLLAALGFGWALPALAQNECGANATPVRGTNGNDSAGVNHQNLCVDDFTGRIFLPAVQSATITGLVTAQNYNGILQANAFVTGGTGTQANPWTSASGTGGIQEALNALGPACSFGVNARLHIPAGFYLVTNTINATANCGTQFGTSAEAGPLIIDGDGQTKSVFIMQTNGGCVIDFTGRNFQFKNIGMTQAGTLPAGCGILQGRAQASVSNFSQHNIVESVFIEMGTTPGANGGNGTVGIYNFASEGTTYKNDVIAGDHGIVITSNNNFAISSLFQTQLTTKRFATENILEGGAYTAEGIVGGEAILLQGHVNNTTIRAGLSTECGGGTPPIVAIRIKAPTAPDGASDPLANLTIQNIQAECPGGQLMATDDLMTSAQISGTVTNAVGVPLILYTAAASQFLNPIINLAVGNSAVSEALISDGGNISGGIIGGTVYMPPTTTIAFTNAASGCTGVQFISSFNSPSITCANVLANNTGVQISPNLYQLQVTGTISTNTSVSETHSVQGTATLTLNTTTVTSSKPFNATAFQTATNCASTGGTCGSAASGSVGITNPATTVTVATTAVTANSTIFIQEDSTLGTKLGATCNATSGRTYMVTTRTGGTSFIITASATPAANTACLNYWIVN